MFVAVSVSANVIRIVGLLVIRAAAAILTIVLAVPQTPLEVINASASIVLLIVVCSVPEAVLVAVSVGTGIVPAVGLLVICTVAAKLAIVLTVLQALLKVPSVSELIVVAVPVLVAILILLCGVLLWRNSGSQTSRAEPGESDSKCQHSYCLF